MKAIIPVAGLGTRLRPHTETRQKTLLPLAGKAALDFIVEPLLDQGTSQITFIIGHLGYQIVDHMKRFSGQFNYVEQMEQLGLGHAVLQGLDDSEEPALIQLGDTIFDVDLEDLTDSTVNRIVVGKVEDPSRFGIVEVQRDRITGFYEKVDHPPSNLAISGLYYFPSQISLKTALRRLIQEEIQTQGEYQLTDAFGLMLEDGETFEAYGVDRWFDTGVPDTYLETNRELLKSSHGDLSAATLKEPVHVGPNCILENSTIGPYVTVMEDCSIKNCHIEDSIVLPGSRLEGQTVIHKIVAGDGSEIC